MELSDYLPIAIMGVLALFFSVVSLGVAALLRPKHPTPEKLDPYECGIVPESEPVDRFPVQFYLVAVIFIAFDIEVIFLYPWAVAMRQLRLFGFFEMFIFVVIIFIAYGFVRKEGVLDWGPRRKLDREKLMKQYRRAAEQDRLDAPDPGESTEAA